MSGKLITNSVFAGVGSPIKESVCLVSILKLANLKQAPNVMTKPKYGKNGDGEIDFNIENITYPGTTPLVTMSARESNCSPNGLETLNNLAKNPSKKSKKMPKQTIKKAISN